VDESISARAKRVSIHNNYFTFPVIALMVSSHFPAVYGHRWNWLLLLVIVASGAGVRHVLNVRFTYPRWKTALAATMVASVVALCCDPLRIRLRQRRDRWRQRGGCGRESTSLIRRCASRDRSPVCCVSFRASVGRHVRRGAGGRDVFDTPEQIVSRMARIRERAVVTHHDAAG
jgi:uncharacterized membrane protein